VPPPEGVTVTNGRPHPEPGPKPEPPAPPAPQGPQWLTAKPLPVEDLNQDIALAHDLPADVNDQILRAINKRRREAGLRPVTLDARLSRGCDAHARYLARNGGPHTTVQLEMHDEDPRLPGYTDEGVYAARLGTVALREPLAAVEGWMRSPGRRAALLNPRLERIGAGAATNVRGRQVAVLDLASGVRPNNDGVVLYPRDAQDRVPLAYDGREVPDPVPRAREKVTGYPVTVTFPGARRVMGASARLTDLDGRSVEAWFSSPEKPANPAYARFQGTCICLMTKKPLKPDTTYRVMARATVDGRPWSRRYQFTTAPASDNAEETRLVIEGLNLYRRLAGLNPVVLDPNLSEGCAAHALYLARNYERVSREHRAPNEEDAGLPGYSARGREAARSTLISFRPRPLLALDSWVGSYLRPLLNPYARSVGLGIAHSADGQCLCVLDPGYRAPAQGAGRTVILFPAEGQTEVPGSYGGYDESLVLPRDAGRGPAGAAVTASFPFGTQVKDVTARLADGTGAAVDCWLSTPDKPVATAYPQASICLLPKAPLRPGTHYTARMTAQVAGRPWQATWRFTTTALGDLTPEQVAAKVVQVVNAHRALAGLRPVVFDPERSGACLAHARYCALNYGHPLLEGLRMHDEDPRLPGFTQQGKQAGKASVICNRDDPCRSVDSWMQTFYHRIPILEPRLKSIAFGYAWCAKQPSWMCVMNTRDGKEGAPGQPAP
jgi:uncharacterized protein YkwD